MMCCERCRTSRRPITKHGDTSRSGPSPILRRAGNTAQHPQTKLYVQFCAPPLAVGREPVVPVELKTKHGTVETLSPTDCVLDRLMQFYHWNDEQALEQAVLVARAQKIDIKRVEEVSTRDSKGRCVQGVSRPAR